MLRLCLLALLTLQARANPTGAPRFPTGGDVNAFRNHGAELTNAVNSVHQLTSPATCYAVGQAISVTLAGSATFNGFVVYGSDTTKLIQSQGTFISTDGNAQSKASESGASFLTHTNPQAKTSVTFTWTPNAPSGSVTLWASLHLGGGVSNHAASLTLSECAEPNLASPAVVSPTTTPEELNNVPLTPVLTIVSANASGIPPLRPSTAAKDPWAALIPSRVPQTVPQTNAGFNPALTSILVRPQVQPGQPQQPQQPTWNPNQWLPPKPANYPPPQAPKQVPSWQSPSNSISGGCFDRAGQFNCLLAPYTKGREYCEKEKQWAMENCKSSCGFCGQAPPTNFNFGRQSNGLGNFAAQNWGNLFKPANRQNNFGFANNAPAIPTARGGSNLFGSSGFGQGKSFGAPAFGGSQSFGRNGFTAPSFGGQRFGGQSFGGQSFGGQSFGQQSLGAPSFGAGFGRQARGQLSGGSPSGQSGAGGFGFGQSSRVTATSRGGRSFGQNFNSQFQG